MSYWALKPSKLPKKDLRGKEFWGKKGLWKKFFACYTLKRGGALLLSLKGKTAFSPSQKKPSQIDATLLSYLRFLSLWCSNVSKTFFIPDFGQDVDGRGNLHCQHLERRLRLRKGNRRHTVSANSGSVHCLKFPDFVLPRGTVT